MQHRCRAHLASCVSPEKMNTLFLLIQQGQPASPAPHPAPPRAPHGLMLGRKLNSLSVCEPAAHTVQAKHRPGPLERVSLPSGCAQGREVYCSRHGRHSRGLHQQHAECSPQESKSRLQNRSPPAQCCFVSAPSSFAVLPCQTVGAGRALTPSIPCAQRVPFVSL